MSVQLIWVDCTWLKKVCPSLFLSPKHGVVGHYTVCNGLHALKVIWLLTEYTVFCPCLIYLYQQNMLNINEKMKSCISNVSQARFCLKCFAFLRKSEILQKSFTFCPLLLYIFFKVGQLQKQEMAPFFRHTSLHHCRSCLCLFHVIILRMLLSPHQSTHSFLVLLPPYFLTSIVSFQ